MTVLWGKKAFDDLDRILDYVSSLSPESGESVIDLIQKAVLKLAEFPNLGAKVDETGLHRLVVSSTPYVIYYRVYSDSVHIRGIFHTSQGRFLE